LSVYPPNWNTLWTFSDVKINQIRNYRIFKLSYEFCKQQIILWSCRPKRKWSNMLSNIILFTSFLIARRRIRCLFILLLCLQSFVSFHTFYVKWSGEGRCIYIYLYTISYFVNDTFSSLSRVLFFSRHVSRHTLLQVSTRTYFIFVY
jgi:hypothetical protein